MIGHHRYKSMVYLPYMARVVGPEAARRGRYGVMKSGIFLSFAGWVRTREGYPSCRPYVTPDCILRMGTVQYCTAIVDKTKDYNDHYLLPTVPTSPYYSIQTLYYLYMLARTSGWHVKTAISCPSTSTKGAMVRSGPVREYGSRTLQITLDR